jgi:hypothetical protein
MGNLKTITSAPVTTGTKALREADTRERTQRPGDPQPEHEAISLFYQLGFACILGYSEANCSVMREELLTDLSPGIAGAMS